MGGQERSKYGPEWASRIYIYEIFLASEPSRGPYLGQGSRKKTQINWGNHLGSIYGVLDPFRGLYRAPKPTVLHWVYSASCILGHILTFSDPPSQPSQIILVQNDLKRCPTNILHVYVQLPPLGGILGPLKSDLGLFWPYRAIYPRYLIFTKSSFKVWLMDG